MFERDESRIGWAIVLSLAIHAGLLCFFFLNTPWQIRQSPREEPITVQLEEYEPSAQRVVVQPIKKTTHRKTTKKLTRNKPAENNTVRGKINPEPAPATETAKEATAEEKVESRRTEGVGGNISRANQQRQEENERPENIYRTYFEQLRTIIEKNQKYPIMAIRGRQQGTVMITFTLKSDGQLLGCRIKQSCGHHSIDRAALHAVQTVKRYPPVPDILGRKITEFEIPVTFKLDGR